MVWPLLDQTLIRHAPRDGGHFEVNRTIPSPGTSFRRFRGCEGKFCPSSVVFIVHMSHPCTPKWLKKQFSRTLTASNFFLHFRVRYMKVFIALVGSTITEVNLLLCYIIPIFKQKCVGAGFSLKWWANCRTYCTSTIFNAFLQGSNIVWINKLTLALEATVTFTRWTPA